MNRHFDWASRVGRKAVVGLIAVLCVVVTSVECFAETKHNNHATKIDNRHLSLQVSTSVWPKFQTSVLTKTTADNVANIVDRFDPKQLRFIELKTESPNFLGATEDFTVTGKNEIESTDKYKASHWFGEQSKTAVDFLQTANSVVISGSLVITILVIIVMRRQTVAQMAKLSILKERFKCDFDNAPDMFCSVDAGTGRIVECNQTMADNLGFTKDEILGRTVVEMYHEGSHEEVKRCFEVFRKTGNVVSEHLRLMKSDGDTIDVSLRSTAIRDDRYNVIRSISVLRDITDIKRAEEHAWSSHIRFTGILDNVPEAVIAMDDSLDIQVFNKAAERIFGYAANEVIGKPLNILIPERFRAGHNRHIQGFTKSSLASRLMSERQDIKALKKDGTEFPATASVTRSILNGESVFTVILQDVTERRAAESALREKTTSLDDAQRIAQMGNWDWDIATDRVYWSDEIYRIFGFEPQQSEISYAKLIKMVHNDDREKVNAAVDASIFDPSLEIDFEYRIIRCDGDERTVRTRGEVTTNSENQAIRVSGTIQDITETKRTESQLIHSAKLAIIGQMASGIAHELNQPLHIIRLATDLALDGQNNDLLVVEEEVKYLSKIRKQIDRMSEIINHMRVFARQDNTPHGSFSPIVSIKNALQLVEPQFNAEGIELKLDLPTACRPVVGATVPLEQVLLNILNNARQAIMLQRENHNDYQGVAKVELIDDAKTSMVMIVISDDAGGIPDAELDQIFKAFYTTKEAGVGTGLGLSISSQIISSMNGSITVKNEDAGARFEITLPVGREMTVNNQVEPEDTKIVPTPQCVGEVHKVMVVDDEDLVVESLSEILSRKGYDVVTASDGLSALELYKVNPVDAIITDLTMPRMGGQEMIHHLRDIKPDLPIIVTTGQITVGENENQIAKGATCIIKKPVSMQQIYQALEQAIRV